MILPNAHLACVPLKKLTDYFLNLNHPDGKHKARLFKSVLNLTTDDAEYLRTVLLDIVKIHPAEYKGSNLYGEKYQVDFLIDGVKVRSCWFISNETGIPSLSSCYIKDQRYK